MKTLSPIILAILVPATAHAEPLSRQAGVFDGGFVSVQVGVQSGEAFETNVRTTSQIFSRNQPDAAGRGLVVRLHGGYGHDLGPMVNLSAGVFAELGGADLDVTIATHFRDQVTQDITDRWGLYVAPGVYVDPRTLVYARFGVARATHRYTRPDYNIALDSGISGQVLGLGVKRMIDDNMFWAIDYTRVNYGLSQIGKSVQLQNFVVDVRSRAVTEDLTIGFGYQF